MKFYVFIILPLKIELLYIRTNEVRENINHIISFKRSLNKICNKELVAIGGTGVIGNASQFLV
jgi:hypothetical protein